MYNIDKKDIENIAYGRVYDGPGLAMVFRILNFAVVGVTMLFAVYFLIVNESSPISLNWGGAEGLKSLPAIGYYIAISIIGSIAVINAFISQILKKRVKHIIQLWEKSGKIPARELNLSGKVAANK